MLAHVFGGCLALESSGRTGEELEVVNARVHFFHTDLLLGLTGVAVLSFHEFVAVFPEALGEVEQRVLAFGRSGPLPGLGRGRRCLECGIDVLLIGDGSHRDRLRVDGVHNVDGVPPVGLHEPTVDVVLQHLCHGNPPC